MRSGDRLVGAASRRSVEQFHEARLVRITGRGFAIGLDPFGMLDPQIVVNLLPELGVGVDLVKHGNWFGKDSSAPRDDSLKRSTESSTSDGAVSGGQQPSEVTPQDGARVLALCATPSQLDYFVALTLQQHGQQSALGKGWG